MPAVSDLDHVRGAGTGSFGVGTGPVAAHDLHAGMLLEPGRDRVGRAVSQHVQWPVGIDVDDDGPVHVPAAEREIVDPHRGHLAGHRVGHRADQAQQRRPAHRDREPPT